METLNQKSLERVVSQKAVQISSSFQCQICVVGFLCGICLTSLFLAALTSFGAASIGTSVSFSPFSTSNSTSSVIISGDCKGLLEERQRLMYSEESNVLSETNENEKVSLLYKAWSELLSKPTQNEAHLTQRIKLSESSIPKAPHLENCKSSIETSQRLDTRLPTRTFPPWTIWKGILDDFQISADDDQLKNYRDRIITQGLYPPWITGSDEENYPLTRKVQRDTWLHQHPMNCNDPNVKFLVADWERLPGFGIGAQLAGMCGLLAIAINEKRVLVTDYYNRADHDGCKGSSRSSWSCYFFPVASQECRKRAFELKHDKEAWEKGVITGKDNYTTKEIWSGRTPRAWGNPWSIMQPTTEINGSLLFHHRKMDRRWWRAQAIRYLMRFQSEYTCNIMNMERHKAFGWEAAKMVLASSTEELVEVPPIMQDVQVNKQDIERFVWSNHKPWMPRPLLSMHVRMGDKACEMKVVGFEEYMSLAEKVRRSFPHLNSVWLSTEMQDVIDRSKSKKLWKFYYTNVTRQTGNTTMATYEASLGRETSTNYPLVNFLMASEADFFIGALGSTWCYLIDGMRNTGGKVMSGYLSVNKDRFW